MVVVLPGREGTRTELALALHHRRPVIAYLGQDGQIVGTTRMALSSDSGPGRGHHAGRGESLRPRTYPQLTEVVAPLKKHRVRFRRIFKSTPASLLPFRPEIPHVRFGPGRPISLSLEARQMADPVRRGLGDCRRSLGTEARISGPPFLVVPVYPPLCRRGRGRLGRRSGAEPGRHSYRRRRAAGWFWMGQRYGLHLPSDQAVALVLFVVESVLIAIAFTALRVAWAADNASRPAAIQRPVSDSVRRTDERAQQAQRLEAVGQLAGGIAHDFNNLLTIILGNVDLILEHDAPPDMIPGLLDDVRSAGQRAAVLTRQLLAFSRREPSAPRRIDLNAVVTDMGSMLRRVIAEHIALVNQRRPGPSPILADVGQIEQVLLNLVVNARDAMPKGGTLTIRTAETDVPARDLPPDAEGPPGRYVVLAVSDTGHGMDASVLARIFEPFFTTKEVGKGTGLGLATVYGNVKQAKGWVTVDSKPGAGSNISASIIRGPKGRSKRRDQPNHRRKRGPGVPGNHSAGRGRAAAARHGQAGARICRLYRAGLPGREGGGRRVPHLFRADRRCGDRPGDAAHFGAGTRERAADGTQGVSGVVHVRVHGIDRGQFGRAGIGRGTPGQAVLAR